MYKLPQEYLSEDPAGIILKNCCESLITYETHDQSLELWEEPPKSVFVLVAIYLSVTTDTEGSGVYIIFSSTDLPKILIACKCSTFNMYACRRYFHESVVVYRGRKREEEKMT